MSCTDGGLVGESFASTRSTVVLSPVYHPYKTLKEKTIGLFMTCTWSKSNNRTFLLLCNSVNKIHAWSTPFYLMKWEMKKKIDTKDYILYTTKFQKNYITSKFHFRWFFVINFFFTSLDKMESVIRSQRQSYQKKKS